MVSVAIHTQSLSSSSKNPIGSGGGNLHKFRLLLVSITASHFTGEHLIKRVRVHHPLNLSETVPTNYTTVRV